MSIFNVRRVNIFLPSIISEPGDHPLPNVLFYLSNFVDELYLSLLVRESHHFIVSLMFMWTMNDNSYVLSSNFSGDDLIGCISNPNVLSSWMLGCLPYHVKWGAIFSKAMCILHLWNSDDVSDAQHNLLSCWLLSRSPDLTILWMLLLCLSFLPLSQDASLPVFSMDIMNSSTCKFVTYV